MLISGFCSVEVFWGGVGGCLFCLGEGGGGGSDPLLPQWPSG